MYKIDGKDPANGTMKTYRFSMDDAYGLVKIAFVNTTIVAADKDTSAVIRVNRGPANSCPLDTVVLWNVEQKNGANFNGYNDISKISLYDCTTLFSSGEAKIQGPKAGVDIYMDGSYDASSIGKGGRWFQFTNDVRIHASSKIDLSEVIGNYDGTDTNIQWKTLAKSDGSITIERIGTEEPMEIGFKLMQTSNLILSGKVGFTNSEAVSNYNYRSSVLNLNELGNLPSSIFAGKYVNFTDDKIILTGDVGANAFNNAKIGEPVEIVIKNGCTKIGADAFNCVKIKKVTVDSDVQATIDANAFRGMVRADGFSFQCDSSNVDGEWKIPLLDPVEEKIGDSTLKVLKISDDKWYVVGFVSLPSNGELTIGSDSKIVKIRESAFKDCNLITKLKIEKELAIDATAFKGSSLKSLEIGDVSVSCGQGAFQDCKLLDTVNVGNSGSLTIGEYAFSGCVRLTTMPTIKNTNIPSDTFSGTSITSVNLNGFVSIGDRAFLSTLIDEIELNNIAVGQYAFANCYNLTEVKIEGTVTLDKYAFRGCIKLSKIEGSVPMLTAGLFQGCSSLSELTLANKKEISYDALAGTAITTFDLSDTDAIGTGVFMGCKQLTTIEGFHYEKMESDLFNGCVSLQTIVFSEGCGWNKIKVLGGNCLTGTKIDLSDIELNVTEIGTNALSGFTLKKVVYVGATVGNKLVGVGNDAFSKSTIGEVSLTNFELAANSNPFRGAKIENVVFYGDKIPDNAFASSEIKRLTLMSDQVEIGKNAFSGCGKLEFIGKESDVLMSGVTTIGEGAFSGCISLSGALNLSSVESIGSSAFMGCSNITEVTLGGTELGNTVFKNCSTLATVNGLDELTTIGSEAFNSTALVDVEISSAKTIGSKAFGGCKDLKSLKIGAGCEYLGDICDDLSVIGFVATIDVDGKELKLYIKYEDAERTSFSIVSTSSFECKQLDLRGLEGLDSIGSYAFINIKGLEEIDIGPVSNIQEGAFFTMTSLKKVTYGPELTSIMNLVFMDCTSLEEIGVRDGEKNNLVTIERESFRGCISLTSLDFIENVKKITTMAFMNCKGITEFHTPVTEIGMDAFSNSGLKSVTLESGVDLGETVFAYCESLETLTFKGNINSTNKSIFKGCTSLETVNGLEKLNSIPDYMFANTGLSGKLELSNKEIGSFAFSGCSNIEQLVFKENVVLKDSAFSDCEKLSKVSFEKGGQIGEMAFQHCVTLGDKDTTESPSLVLDEVESIAHSAFSDCTTLKVVSLPATLSDISYLAFLGCTGIQTMTVADGNSEYMMDADGNTLLTKDGKKIILIKPSVSEYTVAKTVTEIAGFNSERASYYDNPDALSILSNLKKVTVEGENTKFASEDGCLLTKDKKTLLFVPVRKATDDGKMEINISGLERIDEFAFNGIAASELEVSAKEIGTNAFYKCRMVESIIVTSNGDISFDMSAINGWLLNDLSISSKGVASITGGTTQLVANISIDSQDDIIMDVGFRTYIENISIHSDSDIIVCVGLVNSDGYNLKSISVMGESIKVRSQSLIGSTTYGDYTLNLIAETIIGDLGCAAGTKIYVSGNEIENPNGYIYYDRTYGVVTWDGSLKYNDKKVFVLTDLDGVTVTVDSNDFTVTTSDGHTFADISVYLNSGTEALTASNGKYSFTTTSGDSTETPEYYLVRVVEKDDSGVTKWYTVTLDTGGSKSTIVVAEGRSILKSMLPNVTRNGFTLAGWYLDPEFKDSYFGADASKRIVTSDITLYAKWESRGNYLDVDNTAGTFYLPNGQKYVGGSFDKELVLTFVPKAGYTYDGFIWDDGLSPTVDGNKITVSKVTGYKCIRPAVVKYASHSTDLEYVVDQKTPTQSDDLILAWEFSGGKVQQIGMVWSGMPSVPLIVDGYVYVQVNDEIYRLDAETGKTVSYVKTGSSTNEFYHYLGYGGGHVVDYTSGKVYSEGLEYECALPQGIHYVKWHSGHFYAIDDKGTIWKMDVDDVDTESGTMKNQWDATTKTANPIWSLYGTTAHAVVEGDTMYYISISGSAIIINALDLSRGTYTTRDLGITGYLLDDGWLTYYNGYLYITAYTKGLFGASNVKGNAIIGYMKVDGTEIGDMSKVDMGQDRDSLTSAFVIQNGRGYINITKTASTTAWFRVYDIDEKTGEPKFVKEIDSASSHGSIVASTYYYDEATKNGEVYVYLLNYSSDQTLRIFKDTCVNGVWTLSDYVAKRGIEPGYGSQAVRVGTSGQLIFYNDSGLIYCYGSPEFASKHGFFIDNGETAEIKIGDGVDTDAVNAFKKAVANAFGVKSVEFDTGKGTVKIAGTTYYVYYYGTDGIAMPVKFSETFSAKDLVKIKSFYLSPYVKSASDLDPDYIWFDFEGSEVEEYVIKDTMANLRTYQPMTLSKPMVKYSIDDTDHVKRGDYGSLVTIEVGTDNNGEFIVPTKAGYTFLGFKDGEKVYEIGDKYKITSPVTELRPVWLKNNVGITKLSISVGSKTVEDRDSLKLYTGDVNQLNVLIEPEEAGVYEVSSSNTNILSFDGGKLTAIKPGKVDLTITVTSAETTKTVTIGIEIVDRTSSKVTISGNSSISLYKGASTTLSASTDLKGVGVIWTSNDPRIAMVDSNGKVTAISEGVALITATAADDSDVKAVCTVTVSLKKVTSISLSQTSKTMKVGDSSTLSATIAPSDAEDKRVTWSSSNPSVVSVTASGAIQALSKGTAIVTATTVDGSFSASCTVKVEGTVSSISLDKTMLRLEVGSNSTLKATTYPDEALSSNISWTSSDASIVSVSGGYVYAYKVGTATITVSYGDLTVTCTVIVSEKSVVKEDTKENTDGSKTVTKEEKTVSGDSTITTNTEETKDKDDKSMGSDVKISAESENKAVKTEATVKKDADGKVIESNVKTTVEAKIQTKDGKEIVTVSKEDILSAVDQIGAVKNTAGGNVEPVIVIDIGKASTASSSSIDLSYESLVQIADGNDTTLRVNTSAGTLEMSSDVISTLSSDGSDLKLGIEKVSDEGVTKTIKEKVKDSTVFSLTATLGKINVHQLGGKVSVSLPYALKGTVSSDVRIYHVDDDGTLKEMSCKYDANSGMVSFVTDHFSYFVVSEESLVSDAADSDNGISEMNTLLKIVIGLLAVLIAMAVIAMFVHFRGN